MYETPPKIYFCITRGGLCAAPCSLYYKDFSGMTHRSFPTYSFALYGQIRAQTAHSIFCYIFWSVNQDKNDFANCSF